MDVQQFINSLAQLAEKSPEARAFILTFVGELILLMGIVAFFVQRIINRRRSEAESDEDVTNPNAELATAMSKISDALLTFANGFTPLLKNIQESTENTEASIVGLVGEAKKRQPIDTALMESQDVMAQALDRLNKSVANIRTKEDAALQNAELREAVKTDMTIAVTPILAQVTATGIMAGAIDTGVQALDRKVDAIPPHLDALIVKMVAELPPIVRQEFAALVAENKTLTEQKAQGEAANVVYKIQIEQLTADLVARDEQIRVLQATIAALPKPEASPDPVKVEGTQPA